ncbi:MAG: cephalosporin hydroxylase family protein [Desulfobacterales bacterium]|nr:cephalosporin hydroxylase family protein [Desulfobacterales bacterium]
MKLIIDTSENILIHEYQGKKETFDLFSNDSFALISQQWLKIGWNQKYTYAFTWMGRPVIQLPEDMIRIQEVVYRIKPDVIIETGIAHGGSLIYYASLCKVMGKGRVIGIDIEIRPHNRKAIEAHPLFPHITLVEGSSIDPTVINHVRSLIRAEETVMVILDSNHTKKHVLDEIEAYYDLVTPGSYIVVTDGIMRDLYDVPRGNPDWIWDNPAAAAEEFLRQHPEFIGDKPQWPFNESPLTENVTHWPGAWLKRKKYP